jgi:peptidoglycan-N-acetylglucosamine deacetylase
MEMTTIANEPSEAGLKYERQRGVRIPTSRIVTTSWDDGDPSDLRVAELLSARGLGGTFYIPIKGHHKSDRMDSVKLRSLAAHGFEIGAHGVSHPNLPQCGPRELVQEVETCKKQLEDDLNREVRIFAYPRGRYSTSVISCLKQAGYVGARTTRMLARELVIDPYKMPTSVHVYPHSKSDYIKNLARALDLGRAWEYITQLSQATGWPELAKLLFDLVLREGGIWHLYGHSWEIEELGLWDSLEEILSYVSKREGVRYFSNGEVLNFLPVKS